MYPLSFRTSTTLTSGLESKTYRVTSDDGTVLILKERKPSGKQNYPFEAYAYGELAKLGAHVPLVKSADANHLLMTAFLGETLNDKPYLYNDDRLTTAITKDLALGRAVTFEGFGLPIYHDGRFQGQCATWQEYLASARELFKSPRILSSGLDVKELTKLASYWDELQPTIDLEQGMLVHGDFALDAIFVKNATYEGLIDFGDAFIGDPLMDLAYLRFKEITKPYGYELYKRFLKAYSHAADISVNKTAERKINFYMIYWALARLSHCPDDEAHTSFVNKAKRLCEGMELDT